MNDYARVEKVIRYLDKRHAQQPTLGELAAVAGLSEAHFHRLFRRWAGVTPKDFVQCLTAEHAKRRLRESASVLDAALDAGLSGPGRLHDLLVGIEAATPGEYKNGGEGLVVKWGYADSPFGLCSIAWTVRGICHLVFYDQARTVRAPAELVEDWPAAQFARNDRAAARRAKIVFAGEGNAGGTIKAFLRGTPFQLKVWQALLRIPAGGVATYGEIAKLTGDANAARAVGTACGANPVAYLIPCHRVIRETGVVRGYRWGTERKQAILGVEFSRAVG